MFLCAIRTLILRLGLQMEPEHCFSKINNTTFVNFVKIENFGQNWVNFINNFCTYSGLKWKFCENLNNMGWVAFALSVGLLHNNNLHNIQTDITLNHFVFWEPKTNSSIQTHYWFFLQSQYFIYTQYKYKWESNRDGRKIKWIDKSKPFNGLILCLFY